VYDGPASLLVLALLVLALLLVLLASSSIVPRRPPKAKHLRQRRGAAASSWPSPSSYVPHAPTSFFSGSILFLPLRKSGYKWPLSILCQ
jgi:hypothetical protein